MIGQNAKIALYASILAAIMVLINLVHSGGYASGLTDGKAIGFKEGAASQLDLDKAASSIEKLRLQEEVQKTQKTVNELLVDYVAQKTEVDALQTKLRLRATKIPTTYLKEVQPDESNPNPQPVEIDKPECIYNHEYFRVWNDSMQEPSSLFASTEGGVSEDTQSFAYSPATVQDVDPRTRVNITDITLLNNHIDNMSMCVQTKNQLETLIDAVEKAGLSE